MDSLWIQSSFSWTLSIAYRFFKHCECGWRYTGETSVPWAIKLREHRQNLEVGHLVISRLAQHSFEENRHVLWKEAEILRLERIQFTGSIRKQPAWPVYKILLAYPGLKVLPSGTCWSGMECINNTFDPMKIHNLSTVGVSGGWIFSACVMVLYEVFLVWSVWVCSSFYGSGFNSWCVSNAILWVLWLFLIFSVAFFCYN
jgi:hypothetical protein